MPKDFFVDYYKQNKKEIEKCIDQQCTNWAKNPLFPKKLSDSMAYSLQAGGKRLRPLIACICFDFVIAPLCHWENNPEAKDVVKNFAICIEMLHTYSLIHDDLPTIDNDDLRRGKPTCHKVHGEDTAILAGNALQSEAFYLLLVTSKKIDKKDLCKTLELMTEAIGPIGMIGGQIRDILDSSGANDASKNLPSKHLNDLLLKHTQKTGALIRASFFGPLYLFFSTIPSSTIQTLWDPLEKFIDKLGLAYQIVDDILDKTSSTEVLGKHVGSDVKNTKNTFISLLGVHESKEYLKKIEKEAFSHINTIEKDLCSHPKTKIMLQSLWNFVVHRKN